LRERGKNDAMMMVPPNRSFFRFCWRALFGRSAEYGLRRRLFGQGAKYATALLFSAGFNSPVLVHGSGVLSQVVLSAVLRLAMREKC